MQTPFKLQMIKDAYTLKFFENNSSRLPKWCNDAGTMKLPFCQIRGKYMMELPGYNTMDPYPHMNERGLDVPEILVEAERCGSSFDELLTIPEQDDWIYNDGKSTSCVVFILEMYEEAGLFDPTANSIQVTELTIKDAHTAKFEGSIEWNYPGYNTMDPYQHMNERCPSLPPKYSRPKGC
ncbi:unnamed protein product [Camellia sinensis]